MCVDEINILWESQLIGIFFQGDMKEVGGLPIEQLITMDATLGIKILPHWLAQPYWRPITSRT